MQGECSDYEQMRRRTLRLRRSSTGTGSRAHRCSNRDADMMLMALTAAVLFTHIPSTLLDAVDDDQLPLPLQLTAVLTAIGHVLVLSTGSVNLLIYCTFSKNVRRAIKRLLGCESRQTGSSIGTRPTWGVDSPLAVSPKASTFPRALKRHSLPVVQLLSLPKKSSRVRRLSHHYEQFYQHRL